MSEEMMDEIFLSEQERDERIKIARNLIHWQEKVDYDSDQQLHRIQPPLFKEPVSENIIRLPRNFEDLELEKDLVRVMFNRKSSRVYTCGSISLLQFSFLLWSTQGVKGIRGKQYATLRTVPSGGARHPFELYPIVLRVDGLEPGLYHYLAKDHTLEVVKTFELDEESIKMVSDSVCGQSWAVKGAAILNYSIIPYRGEWRYGFNAHRVMMMDAGHAMQNVYIACSAMGLGTCAVGAIDDELLSEMYGFDNEEEFMLCCIPVGTISADSEKDEAEFYSFLKTEEQYYHEQ